ncbi:MAG: carboxymuconolactone decarboxylase family protein [Bacteroidota bacterium]
MITTLRNFKMDVTGDEGPEVREVFDWYEANFQFVPNLTKVMSASPALLRSYWQTQVNLQQIGTLTPEEDNIVQMTIAVENACKYCTAGHHLAGRVFFNSKEEDLEAIREKSSLSSEKFDALAGFAKAVYRSQGRVKDQVLEDFYAAGYNQAQALDVVANVAVKVMSNFTNQLTLNEVDEAFAPLAEGLAFA